MVLVTEQENGAFGLLWFLIQENVLILHKSEVLEDKINALKLSCLCSLISNLQLDSPLVCVCGFNLSSKMIIPDPDDSSLPSEGS